MTDAARKILPAHKIVSGRARELPPGQIHVDGGVNRKSAELCGGLAADVLVVGSVLWKKGTDIGKELRLIKALADEGYRNGAGRGKAAVPHDEWTTFATLPRPAAVKLATDMEAAAIPVLRLRAGRIEGSHTRAVELVIRCAHEGSAVERFGEARRLALAATASDLGPGDGV